MDWRRALFCSACGGEVKETDRFCPKCGRTVTYAAPAAYAAQPGVSAPPVAARRYAGFWLRFVAYLIDGLIVGIPVTVVVLVVIAMLGGLAAFHGLPQNPDPQQVTALVMGLVGLILPLVLCSVVISWLYFAMMESSARQATLGKGVLSLRVTDLNGQRVSFGRASGRYFSKIITGLVPLAIGWILAGFTAKKQALHDFIAGTLVWRDS
jgi:uncharacterized RDD family membrane protein YckC